MYDSMRGDINKYIVCLFYVAWIFLGNFILLNLFLAILLDSFLNEEDEDDKDDAYNQKRKLKLERAKIRRLRKLRKFVRMGCHKA